MRDMGCFKTTTESNRKYANGGLIPPPVIRPPALRGAGDHLDAVGFDDIALAKIFVVGERHTAFLAAGTWTSSLKRLSVLSVPS